MLLKTLRIQHIVLIENEEINFSPGLNILTGETGAGKSSLIEACLLALGEKAQSSLVRFGKEKGSIEAIFEIDGNEEIKELLHLSGIDHEEGEDLIIRRDIFSSGKSRSFVNQTQVQLHFLKNLSQKLVKFSGQMMSRDLLEPQGQMAILDRFSETEALLKEFKEAKNFEKKLEMELVHLKLSQSERIRKEEMAQFEIEEIRRAKIVEGEEDALFQEYSRLNAKEKLLEWVGTILGSIPLAKLKPQKSLFEKIVQKDPSLQEVASSFNQSLTELQEVTISLEQYQRELEFQPERAAFISERLSLITKIKKKYGPELVNVFSYLKSKEEELKALQNHEFEIHELEEKIKPARDRTNLLAKQLSDLRKRGASRLSEETTSLLRSLNMPDVKFEIDLTPQLRADFGDEQVDFLIAPNLGEKLKPVKDTASGGELSRLLLALQTLTASKESIPILIFDEIDSNIGGRTATFVGDLLFEMGRSLQILLVTHFPQVAMKADHHLQIAKFSENDRTFSKVTLLDTQGKKREIHRMLGEKEYSECHS